MQPRDAYAPMNHHVGSLAGVVRPWGLLPRPHGQRFLLYLSPGGGKLVHASAQTKRTGRATTATKAAETGTVVGLLMRSNRWSRRRSTTRTYPRPRTSNPNRAAHATPPLGWCQSGSSRHPGTCGSLQSLSCRCRVRSMRSVRCFHSGLDARQRRDQGSVRLWTRRAGAAGASSRVGWAPDDGAAPAHTGLDTGISAVVSPCQGISGAWLGFVAKRGHLIIERGLCVIE